MSSAADGLVLVEKVKVGSKKPGSKWNNVTKYSVNTRSIFLLLFFSLVSLSLIEHPFTILETHLYFIILFNKRQSRQLLTHVEGD